MKLKAIKSLWAGAKSLKREIKKLRTEYSSNTLALKRQEAQNYVETISDETWDKMSKAIFEQKGDSKSILLDKLHKYKKFCDDNGIEMPEDVLQAYKQLEYKAAIFSDRMSKAKAKGKTPENYWDFGEKFKKNNQEAFDKLEKFAQEQQDTAMQKYHDVVFNSAHEPKAADEAKQMFEKIYDNKLDIHYIPYEELYNPKIGTVSDGIIKNGQVFYHGTKKQRAISKSGFHLMPKKSQAMAGARELGEGVYLTPDKKVASSYAGIFGGILPVKIDNPKVAVVNNAQLSTLTRKLVMTLGAEESQNPAIMELVVKKLFQRNGYSAAYSKEALGSGIFAQNKLVDVLSGGKQSQLVVFDPKDIQILDKTLKERIGNEILQIRTALKTPGRAINYIREQRKQFAT